MRFLRVSCFQRCCLLPRRFCALRMLRAAASLKTRKADEDSPLVTRFPGSIIHSCENKEYEQADFPMGDKDTKAPGRRVSQLVDAQKIVAWN